MAIRDEASAMADAYGCPEFYAPHIGLIEDAGCGNLRIFRCVKRGGMLVPVFSLIAPIETLLADVPVMRDIVANYIRANRRNH